METIDFLRGNTLFKDLEENELKKIASLTIKKISRKNSIIINESDTSSSMYLIMEGRVNVTVTDNKGKEFILTTLHENDYFGELSLLDGKTRSANIITMERCVFVILRKADFFLLLQQNHIFANNLIKSLCQKIRFINDIAQSMALLDTYGRLAKLLQELSSPREDGKLITLYPLTQQAIATRLGCSRERISRILKELEKGEYLLKEKGKYIINKKLPSAW